MRRASIILGTVAASTSLTLVSGSVAFADNLHDNLTTTAQATQTITQGGSVTVSYYIGANGSDGCNVDEGNAATMATNAPAGVTATPATLSFRSCGTSASQSVTYTSSTAGTYAIAPTISGGKSGNNGWGTNDARFSLAVQAPVVQADTTPPTISGTDTTLDGWFNTDQTRTFTASDSGSGLRSAFDSSFSLTVSDESASATVPTTVSKTVLDNAGNSATRSLSAFIDKTDPGIEDKGALSQPNSSGWYNSAVTNRFERTDALSGLAVDQTVNKDVTTTAQGLAVKVSSGTVSDKAGNSADAVDSAAFKIDLTKPTNTVTGVADGATYKFNDVPVAGCDTNDSLSGVASVAALTTVQPSGVGTKTVTCSGGSDVAGNNAETVSATYKVQYATSTILQPLNADGSSKVKLGSTVPVKIKLEDASAGFGGATINISNSKLTSVLDGEAVFEDIPVVTAHTGTQLRYDAAAGQYIYNLSTKNLSTGTWRITLNLGDGTTRTVQYAIAK